MIELNESQVIKLNDFKEQLASIKKNVDVANKELEVTLEKARLSDEAFKKDSARKAELLEDLTTKIVTITEDCETKLGFIDDATKKLVLREAESVRRRDMVEVEISELKNDIKSGIKYKADLNEDVSELEKVRKQLKVEIENSTISIVELEEEISHKRKQLNLVANELADLKSIIISTTATYNADRVKLTSELADLEKKLEAESDKIVIPRQSLDSEIAEFEKYRMDVRVLYDRANRMWTVMYPGKSLEEILKRK